MKPHSRHTHLWHRYRFADRAHWKIHVYWTKLRKISCTCIFVMCLCACVWVCLSIDNMYRHAAQQQFYVQFMKLTAPDILAIGTLGFKTLGFSLWTQLFRCFLFSSFLSFCLFFFNVVRLFAQLFLPTTNNLFFFLFCFCHALFVALISFVCFIVDSFDFQNIVFVHTQFFFQFELC